MSSVSESIGRAVAALLIGSSSLAASLGSAQSPVATPAQPQKPAPSSPATDPQYILGPEDLVTVTVIRHPEFSGDFPIPDTGIIQVPVVGDVNVSGMAISALRDLIVKKLADRINTPEVTVTLKTAKMRRFFVFGAIQHSGVYEFKPGWGVSEGLSASGGLNPGEEQKDVRIILEHTATGQKVSMPLDEALAKSTDPSLKIGSDDVLRIESIATLPIYISGKVKVPGMYRMREDASGLLAVIAQAGGVTDDASLANVRIIRLKGAEQVVDLTPTLIRGESATLPVLAAGDMVVVSENVNRVSVLGYVAKPGYYPLPDGRTYTLSDAIAMAEGADRRGRLTQVGLVRFENGKQIRKVYDLGKFLRNGDGSQNPMVMSGDVIFVPETNRADTSTILSALTSGSIFFNAVKR